MKINETFTEDIDGLMVSINVWTDDYGNVYWNAPTPWKPHHAALSGRMTEGTPVKEVVAEVKRLLKLDYEKLTTVPVQESFRVYDVDKCAELKKGDYSDGNGY